MIRLEIYGSGDETARQVFARLRGATAATPTDSEATVLWSGLYLTRLAEDLLSRGRHVLLPVEAVDSLDLLNRLTAAAQRGGAKLAIMNPQRFQSSRKLIKEQIDAGKLGQIGLVRLHRWEHDRGKPLSGFPSRLVGDLELAMWLTGSVPEVIFAASSQDTAFVQVHLGFTGGASVLLDFTSRLPPGDEYRSLSVIGSTGAAHADDQHTVQLSYLGGAAQARRASGGAAHIAAVVQAFVDKLTSNHDFADDLAGWRKMLQIGAAIQESLRTGRTIGLVERLA